MPFLIGRRCKHFWKGRAFLPSWHWVSSNMHAPGVDVQTPANTWRRGCSLDALLKSSPRKDPGQVSSASSCPCPLLACTQLQGPSCRSKGLSPVGLGPCSPEGCPGLAGTPARSAPVPPAGQRAPPGQGAAGSLSLPLQPVEQATRGSREKQAGISQIIPLISLLETRR